jgi:simple sugar transport system ATP-binding protein
MRQGEIVGRFRVGEVTETEVAHLISHGVMPERGEPRRASERRLIGSTQAVDSGTKGQQS